MHSVNKLSDQDLAALLREGNEAAYVEIYQRFKGVLHLHAYKKLGGFEEAQDIIQELFAILWDKRESIPLTTNFSGYLYQSLRNRIFNHIAHKEVESKYFTSIGKFVEAGNAATDYKVRERELSEKIEAEINNLPEKMRQVFILSRKYHLSHKEIADKLMISESTVKNHVKNALKVLRIRIGSAYSVFLFLF